MYALMFKLAIQRWREVLIGALAITLITTCIQRDHRLEAKGEAKEKTRRADSTLAVLAPQAARVDTLWRHDTLRVRETIARLDTLRDTVLLHLTDTVLVKEFVARADSVAKACTALSNDCATARSIAAQRIAALQAKLDAQPIAMPRSCTSTGVIWGGLGIVGGLAAGRYLSHH